MRRGGRGKRKRGERKKEGKELGGELTGGGNLSVVKAPESNQEPKGDKPSSMFAFSNRFTNSTPGCFSSGKRAQNNWVAAKKRPLSADAFG
jgi:hypothetical protein